ncbi:hypothetical protein GCM10023191_027510 [Actinoallomurus oryzae]|uniref:Uncharacterized protein n=1 Tax=Actinoallomurus oryzae TaxID=502180 RepID=A0ABP8PTV2_9ACTN
MVSRHGNERARRGIPTPRRNPRKPSPEDAALYGTAASDRPAPATATAPAHPVTLGTLHTSPVAALAAPPRVHAGTREHAGTRDARADQCGPPRTPNTPTPTGQATPPAVRAPRRAGRLR